MNTNTVQGITDYYRDVEPFAYCFTDVNGKAKELCSAPTKDDDPRDMRTITALYKHPPDHDVRANVSNKYTQQQDLRQRLFHDWRGCSNHGCVVTGTKKGMGTNGACNCIVNASRTQLTLLQSRLQQALAKDEEES